MYNFAIAFCAGGVEPRPYGMTGKLYEFAGRVPICDCTLRGRGKPLPYVTTKNV